MTGSQQDVVAGKISMQHINLMQVSQRSSNLLGCQQNTGQVWLSHWDGFDWGRSEPALLDSILQSHCPRFGSTGWEEQGLGGRRQEGGGLLGWEGEAAHAL